MIKNRINFTARVCVLITCFALSYAYSAEQKPKTEQVKSSLDQIKDKIRSLTQALTATREEHDSSTEALKQAEVSVSQSKKKLNDIQETQSATQKRLIALNQQLTKTQQAVVTQQSKISKQLQQQYTHAPSSYMQLLLENKDPNQLTRDMKYFGYLSQARLDEISALKETMEQVSSIKEETTAKHRETEVLKQKYQEEAKNLERDKSNKAQVVAQLAHKIETQQQQIARLKQDEQSLSNLFQRLTEQAEKRRQQMERDKKEREKLAKQEKRTRNKHDKNNRDTNARDKHSQDKMRAEETIQEKKRDKHNRKPSVIDEESKSPNIQEDDTEDNAPSSQTVARNDALPDNSVASINFNALRGQLRLPVRGEVTNRFGTARSDTGVTWKGIFIRAHEGSEVKSVASGRVVFADWMRGFGNLIIVEHGNGYMTLYGNNEALLKNTGQSVRAGDTIASAGNSGGNPETGVYFEVRRNSLPLDPMQWSRAH